MYCWSSLNKCHVVPWLIICKSNYKKKILQWFMCALWYDYYNFSGLLGCFKNKKNKVITLFRCVYKNAVSSIYHWMMENSPVLLVSTMMALPPPPTHYSDVIMSTMVSQITSVFFACTTICSHTDERKHQSSTSLAFVRGIHWSLMNSPQFPTQRASNADNVSIWWHHHAPPPFESDICCITKSLSIKVILATPACMSCHVCQLEKIHSKL